jgi:hypothetical protein
MLNPHYTNSTFHVSVKTVAAQTYFLQSCGSLFTLNWTNTTSVPGDGTLKELVDTNAVAPVKFYRVKAQ